MKRLSSLLALLLAAPLAAQEKPAPAPTPAPRTFDFGAQIRLRGDSTNNLDLSEDKDDRDAYVFSRVRLWGAFRRGEKLSAFLELQDSRVFGSETSPTSNEKNVDLHQGWLKVGSEKTFLRLGRQELAYGEQRLVGAFDWDNVGRAFDGGLGRMTFQKLPVVLDGFWAKVKESAAPPEQNDVSFAGLHATWKAIPKVDLDTYAFLLSNGERNAAGDDRLVATFGARGHGAHGPLVWDLEGAFQTGHELADSRRAWAAAGYVRYEFPVTLKPSFGLEASTASGDGDAGDGTHREFDNLFPTNHLKYGFLDLIGWRNQNVVAASVGFAGASTKWTARLFLRAISLRNAAGAWKSAGGALLGRDETGASGRNVGTELDFAGSWPFLPGLTAHLQAGWLRPGSFAKKVRGGNDALGAAAYLVFAF